MTTREDQQGGESAPRAGDVWRQVDYDDHFLFTGRRMPKDPDFWECLNMDGTFIEGFRDSCFRDGTLVLIHRETRP